MTHIFTMTCSYLSHTVQFNKVLFDTWLNDALKVRRMIDLCPKNICVTRFFLAS